MKKIAFFWTYNGKDEMHNYAQLNTFCWIKKLDFIQVANTPESIFSWGAKQIGFKRNNQYDHHSEYQVFCTKTLGGLQQYWFCMLQNTAKVSSTQKLWFCALFGTLSRLDAKYIKSRRLYLHRTILFSMYSAQMRITAAVTEPCWMLQK